MPARNDFEELERAVRALLEALPEDMHTKALATFRQKEVYRRMRPFLEAVSELANNVPTLPSAASREELNSGFAELARHVQGILEDAVLLFTNHRYASSQFMSIVGIEELGKVAVARIHKVCGQPKQSSDGKLARKLRHHTTKHFLAASAGAVINSRMDRVVGIPTLLTFLDDAESGALEAIRQRALYYEVDSGSAHVPRKAVTRYEAAKYLVIFGELLAEVATADPEPFEVLLKKVERLEKRIGWKTLATAEHAF